jgi:hypothetical protein
MNEKDFLTLMESGISTLPQAQQGIVFRGCAEKCARGFVLDEMRRQFEECGGTLDSQYAKYGNTEYFYADIIEPGHIYEMGYLRCFCPLVSSGFANAPAHCECSRQSILFVLGELLPGRKIEVETLETVLSGGAKCKFKVVIS